MKMGDVIFEQSRAIYKIKAITASFVARRREHWTAYNAMIEHNLKTRFSKKVKA